MKDLIVNERYRVDYKVGKGGSGLVYAGTDLKSNEEVALKLMHRNSDFGRVDLRSESETYQELSGGTGIPRFWWYGDEEEYYVLVLELLGPSLEDLFHYCDRRFSLRTIFLIAEQAITRIEYMHKKGFLHLDIKPENFLMGAGRRGSVLYVADFGLAMEFNINERDQPGGNRHFEGTRDYASLNNHNGLEQSWRDDLESLGYMFVYFARGSLPWQELGIADEDEEIEAIRERKMTLSVNELCEGLPDEFAKYIDYTRVLGFNTRPNYRYLRQLFRRRFASEGFKHDNIYDWTAKRFDEIHSHADDSDSAAPETETS